MRRGGRTESFVVGSGNREAYEAALSALIAALTQNPCPLAGTSAASTLFLSPADGFRNGFVVYPEMPRDLRVAEAQTA